MTEQILERTIIDSGNAVITAPPPSRPKVSIMLITYNHGRFIAQALDSVLMQKTNFRFTINVIEDCSTDNTATIVREYAARYPDIVIPYLNKKNIGYKVTQKNFFRGFKTLNGEYLAILEGDDYWLSDHKLQKQVDFLDSHPDFVICAHNTIKIYEDKSIEPHRFLYYGKQLDTDIDDAIMLRSFYHTTGVLYRNVFNGIPPRKYINKWSCDIFIFISHAEHGKIHHMDEDMAVYRAHAGGRFSTMNILEGWKFNIGGLQRYNAWLGFRHMRTFSRSIARYCDIVLKEAGTNGIPPLSTWQRIKYTCIKHIYGSVQLYTDAPQAIVRKLLAISLRGPRAEKLRRRGHSPGALVEYLRDRNWPPSRSMQIRFFVSLLAATIRVFNLRVSSAALPALSVFGPQSAPHNTVFNAQPDGSSAIWIRVASDPPPETRLIFDGAPLSANVDGNLVTAAVPSHLTARPGFKPFWLEADLADGLGVSDPAYFEVT